LKTALLHNDQVIHADAYDSQKHGTRLYCIDKTCRAPLIFVPKSKKAAAHFKTTGRHDSQHTPTCGFFQPLECKDAIRKVKEYQGFFLEGENIHETVIRLDMKRIDPDYEPRQVERSGENKEKKEKIKVKEERENPESVGSVKSVVKLLTSYEPDLLATVLFNVGGGRKVPLSSIVINQEDAHHILMANEVIRNVGYFVYGTVKNLIRREKVWYVNYEPVNNITFTLVIFDRYFEYFTYTDEELVGKDVLTYGFLRKNEYQGEIRTEMLIKSDKYLEIIGT
jgi:hypothetical protein